MAGDGSILAGLPFFTAVKNGTVQIFTAVKIVRPGCGLGAPTTGVPPRFSPSVSAREIKRITVDCSCLIRSTSLGEGSIRKGHINGC